MDRDDQPAPGLSDSESSTAQGVDDRQADRADAGQGDRGRNGRYEPSDDRHRAPRTMEPALPEGADWTALDRDARAELRSLPKSLAETVGAHLVAAGTLVDDDPVLALEHARYARKRASRVPIVREAAGLAAYHAGEWAEALSELRAVRRMTGSEAQLAVLADCERALGRPERAIDLAKEAGKDLPHEVAVELRIVSAGARRDLGQTDAAVVALQGPDLDPARRDPWSARLFYAYADNLAAAGRTDEAIRWFLAAAEADDDEETDAADRAIELGTDPDELAARLAVSDVTEDPGAVDGSRAGTETDDVAARVAGSGVIEDAAAVEAVDGSVAGAGIDDVVAQVADAGVIEDSGAVGFAVAPDDGVSDVTEDARTGDAQTEDARSDDSAIVAQDAAADEAVDGSVAGAGIDDVVAQVADAGVIEDSGAVGFAVAPDDGASGVTGEGSAAEAKTEGRESVEAVDDAAAQLAADHAETVAGPPQDQADDRPEGEPR